MDTSEVVSGTIVTKVSKKVETELMISHENTQDKREKCLQLYEFNYNLNKELVEKINVQQQLEQVIYPELPQIDTSPERSNLVGSYLEVSNNILMLDMIGMKRIMKHELAIPCAKSSLAKILHDIVTHQVKREGTQ